MGAALPIISSMEICLYRVQFTDSLNFAIIFEHMYLQKILYVRDYPAHFNKTWS